MMRRLPANSPGGNAGFRRRPLLARPLETALVASGALLRLRCRPRLSIARAATGATKVRLQLSWREIAPDGAVKPAGFDPANPFDARYRWGGFDQLAQRAVAAGLEPLHRDQRGANLGRAHKRRAGGHEPAGRRRARPFCGGRRRAGSAAGSRGLPRVKAWEVWNEANASFFLFPQKAASRAVSPDLLPPHGERARGRRANASTRATW